MAEESSRSTFQTLESLVGAVGNIAMLLDSSLFAITSSFRAVLNVAANFSHLKGVFAQFWSSFALVRSMMWLYRKVLYTLRLSHRDPTDETFKEAFKAANGTVGPGAMPVSNKRSFLSVILFLSFILGSPYLLMKMLARNNDLTEMGDDPQSWKNPLTATVLHNFEASNALEMSVQAGQTVLIAPKEVQVRRNLLNTGWVLAASGPNKQPTGLIPLNYVQGGAKTKPPPTGVA